MQPELFQDLPTESAQRRFEPPLFPSRFIRVRVAYEDLIFSALGFLLVLLAGFCLGVERGKRFTTEPTAPWMATNATPAAASAAVAGESLPLPSEPVDLKGPSIARDAAFLKPGQGRYAIQLASYLDSQSAQAEAIRLRRQRFRAEVVKQGKYFELRVTGFQSREEAKTHLAILRKTYHDGFIKQLSTG